MLNKKDSQTISTIIDDTANSLLKKMSEAGFSWKRQNIDKSMFDQIDSFLLSICIKEIERKDDK